MREEREKNEDKIGVKTTTPILLPLQRETLYRTENVTSGAPPYTRHLQLMPLNERRVSRIIAQIVDHCRHLSVNKDVKPYKEDVNMKR